jgi:predicted neuraminidase
MTINITFSPLLKIVLLFITSILSLQAQIDLKIVSQEMVYETPPFEACHASTILETHPNQFLVAAFGGSREGNKDVTIWLSKGKDSQWDSPNQVADGISPDGNRYPNWNPVLFKERNGTVFLFYKIGPSPREWWGAFKTSSHNGKDWSQEKRLPDPILGPIKNKPIQLDNGVILAPSSTETRTAAGLSWKAHIEKSEDGGKDWEKIEVDPQTPFNLIQPSILIHSQEKLQILCRSRDNALLQAFSYDGGNSWGKITKTTLPNPNSGTDALTLTNGWHVLVYNPTLKGRNARAKLNVAVSKNGKDWQDALVLENENKGEFSYPALIQSSDGNLHLTYTFNRKNIKHVVLQVE